MKHIKSRLARGSLWISGARWFGNGLSFVVTILLARLLTPADFGLVALALTLQAVVAAFAHLPAGSVLIFKRNPTAEHCHTAWTLGAARGILLAAVFGLSAYPFSLLYGDARLQGLIYIVGLNVLVGGLGNPRLFLMQKDLVFWQTFVLDVTNYVVAAGVSVGLALVYRSYWAIILGPLAGQAASVALSYALFPFRPRMCWKHMREFFSFTSWLTLRQAVDTLNQRFDHFLVGGILGNSALGHYSVGSSIAAIPSREAVQPLSRTMFPAFAAIAHDTSRLRNGYQRAQTLITSIALPIGVGFVLVADPLVRLLMGEKWLPAIGVIQVIGAVYAFATLGNLVASMAMATGATRTLFVRSLQIFVIRIPLILAGLYLGGLVGLLYGRALAGSMQILINLRMVGALTGLSIATQLRANWRCLTATAAMCVIVLVAQASVPPVAGAAGEVRELVVSVPLGAAAYVTISLLLWIGAGKPSGPEQEAAELARKVIRRFTERSIIRRQR